MRGKIKTDSASGNIRIKEGFLFIPRKLPITAKEYWRREKWRRQWRWLEWASIEQLFFAGSWLDRNWVEEE